MKKEENTSIEVINKNNELIQTILDNQKKGKTKERETAEIPEVFTSTDFFTDNNPFGLMSIETFRMLQEVMSESELHEFMIVLDKLNADEYIEFSPVPYGRGKFKKLYASINGPRGREKFSIPAVDNVSKFLALYIMRKFTCKFPLEEIYNLAK